MKAYESGSAAYFATPPVNLIYAYHESLRQITTQSPSLEQRFKLHREASQRVKDVASDLGLKQLPLDPAYAANGMTAVYIVQIISYIHISDVGLNSCISRMALAPPTYCRASPNGALLLLGDSILRSKVCDMLLRAVLPLPLPCRQIFPYRVRLSFPCDISLTFFRYSHMGVTVVDAQRSDITSVVDALREVLAEARRK